MRGGKENATSLKSAWNLVQSVESLTLQADFLKHGNFFPVGKPRPIPAVIHYLHLIFSKPCLFFAVAFIAVTADAAVVTNTNDSGPGSLRDTIAAAPSGEVITFATGLARTNHLALDGRRHDLRPKRACS